MDTRKNVSQIFVFVYCVGFSYLISPGSGSLPFEEQLCHIQCHLFCKNQSVDPQNDVCVDCAVLRKGPWLFNCSRPAECSGTCHMFKCLTGAELLPVTPKLESKFLSASTIQLYWLGSSNPSNEVSYLIQKKENGKWIEEKRLQNTSLIISNLDVCTAHIYRIIAINKYGSPRASEELIIDKPTIGKVTDVRLVQNWELDSLTSEFKAVIQCEIPEGWEASDIDGCVYEVTHKNCPRQFNSAEQFRLYFDTKDKTRTQLRILSKAFSCSYDIEVNAVSRCKEKGGSFHHTLNLTECSAIRGFVCPTVPFDPPGVVKDVLIHATYDGNVDIGWKPPSDLGTVGVVNAYGIRWGKVELETDLMDFITLGTTAHVWSVQQNFTRISLKRHVPHNIYGIQIIALYPGQSLKVDEWDLFAVYPFCYKGEADLNIDSISNLRQVNVSWVTARWPERSCKNLTEIQMYKRYVVRWGPADSTDVQTMTITSFEGTAIFSVNTSLLFNITKPDVPYGMMVIPVKSKGYLPTDEDWKNATSYSFTVQSKKQTERKKVTNWGVVTFGLGIAASAMVMIGTFIYRRKQTKHLVRLNKKHEVSSHIYYVQPVERYLPHSQLIGALDPEERSWEVPYQSLRFQNELGRGAFGKVFKAEINSCWLLRNKQDEGQGPPKRLTVAVKMLQESAKEIFQMDFIREIQVMKKIGFHENIVSMLGCCTSKSPICLIVEHISLGDLLSYLRSQRQNITKVNCKEDVPLHYVNCSDVMTSSRLLFMARQIACGMEYLSFKGFVHRDLAARNVLVADDLTMKIGDFGLTRYIYNDKVYVNLKGGKLPIKWMSIEAIFDRTFSSASDVWSFGILLYEMISLGGVPYPTLDASNLLNELGKGYRMKRPDNCSHQLYDLMLACWRALPEERPSFDELTTQLEALNTGEKCGQPHIILRAENWTGAAAGYHEILRSETGEGRSDDRPDVEEQNHRTSKLPCPSFLSRSFSSPPLSPSSPHSSSSSSSSSSFSSSSFPLSSPPPHPPSLPISSFRLSASTASTSLSCSPLTYPLSPSFSPPSYSPPPTITTTHPRNGSSHSSSISSLLADGTEDDEVEEDVFVVGETQYDQFCFPRKKNSFINASYTGIAKGLILKPANLNRKGVGSILSTSSTSQLIGSKHE